MNECWNHWEGGKSGGAISELHIAGESQDRY